MKLGINLLYLSGNTNTGIGKHAESLLLGFREIDLLKDCCLFVKKSFYSKAATLYPEAQIIEIPPNPVIDFFLKHKKVHHNFYEGLHLNHRRFIKAAKDAGVTMMLYPFNDSTLRFVKNIPNIIVIHDLSFQKYPEYYGRLLTQYSLLKHHRFLAKADFVIAISEYVKKDIERTFKTPNDIIVIPSPVTIALQFTSFSPIDGPYLLSIASFSKYKNIITLLKAYKLIYRRLPHQLVLVGRDHGDTASIQEYIQEYELQDRVIVMQNIPDEHRNSIIKNASLLVVPSLYENFGRVAIEAALLKTPVLSSKTSALPEVTLGLLNYYEPATDSHILAMRILELLMYPPSYEKRTAIADRFVHTYNEKSIADQFNRLFTKLEET